MGIKMISAASKHNKNKSESPYDYDANKDIDDHIPGVLPILLIVDKDPSIEKEEGELD